MRFKNLASIDRIDFIVVHSDVGPVDVNNTWDVIPTAYQFVRDGELGEPIKTTSKGFQIRCFQWFADQTDGSVEDKSRAFTEDINELPFSNRKLPFIIHEGYLEDPSIYNAVE